MFFSLDYALAFDHCSPAAAGVVFQALGLPAHVWSMLNATWSDQRRWLEFGGCCLGTPVKVDSSLPQGDAWSMIAMCAMLMPATAEITSAYPSSLLRMRHVLVMLAGPPGLPLLACGTT